MHSRSSAPSRLGKLTLFVADGPRRSGVLERVALRVRISTPHSPTFR